MGQLLLGGGAAVLGAILGSFLNALLFRFHTGHSVMQGRSHCLHCGHTLKALDLVPLLSFLWLQGRCRWCGSKISLQYPLVEVFSALLSVLLFLSHPDFTYLFWLPVWLILLFIVVYDSRHAIIPWSASGLLLLFSVGYLIGGHASISMLLAGLILALPLLLLSLASRGRWMGWGDPVLELSLGWFLGLSAGGTALVIAFWSGALVGIALMVFNSSVTMKSEVPFAPFLVFGAFVVFFFHVDLFSSISLVF